MENNCDSYLKGQQRIMSQEDSSNTSSKTEEEDEEISNLPESN